MQNISMAKAKTDNKKAVFTRYDDDEIFFIDTMRKMDVRDRTSFLRWLVRAEAERRKLKPPAKSSKPPVEE